MRGARPVALGGMFAVGLIPVRTGNMAKYPPSEKPAAAHPRSRGEHLEARELAAMFLGSSPPVRGALLRTPRLPLLEGLIPARAGST